MTYIAIDKECHAGLAMSLFTCWAVQPKIQSATFISHAPLLASLLFGFNKIEIPGGTMSIDSLGYITTRANDSWKLY
jgi:hypothetical protein